jgi:hypothetical protein
MVVTSMVDRMPACASTTMIRKAEARAMTGEGSLFALSDNKYIGGHGGDHIALGCGLRVPEDWVTVGGVDWDNPPEAREALLREFSGGNTVIAASGSFLISTVGCIRRPAVIMRRKVEPP